MTVQVAVQTGSRLHLGPLAHRPAAGRHFGGVGLMIDRPGVQLSALAADRDEVSGPVAIKERVEKILARYRQQVSDDRQPPGAGLTWRRLDLDLSNGGEGSRIRYGRLGRRADTHFRTLQRNERADDVE